MGFLNVWKHLSRLWGKPAGGASRAAPRRIERQPEGTTVIEDASNQQHEEEQRWAQQVIVDLTRESGNLRWEVTRKKHLANDALKPLMPLVRFHSNGLMTAVNLCNKEIERANAQLNMGNEPNDPNMVSHGELWESRGCSAVEVRPRSGNEIGWGLSEETWI